MSSWEKYELTEFLSECPSMRLVALSDKQAVIVGTYQLKAKMDGFKAIDECYQLEIVFPINSPRLLPTAKETGNRIPRNEDFHTYPSGIFCLGSDIKLKSILLEHPTITDFFEKVLDPFLYSISYKISYDIFPFGDLAHGEAGLIDDYQILFGVDGKVSVVRVLLALSKRKREANKLLCPCGNGQHKIGQCVFRYKIELWRRLGARSWFKEHLSLF